MMMRRGLSFAVAVLGSALAVSAMAADSGPGGIAFKPRGDGWVLTDAEGMTLYTTSRDVDLGKSSCLEGCAAVWPPVALDAAVAVDGEWSAFTREDGIRQLAYRGRPLYTYDLDASAGDAFGDDVGRVWGVAFKPIFTPPEARIAKTLMGRVLADSRAMTLYASDAEKDGKPGCDAKCLTSWSPLGAPWAANTKGDWSTVVRADGSKQWAFRGRPLYRYLGDAQPGQTGGEGRDGQWHVLVLEAPPPLPAWVRIHESDAGELYTDADGRTLYQYQQPNRRRRVANPEDDIAPIAVLPKILPDYRPVLAAADAKPAGQWSLVEREGAKQWAFKGLPLFTNRRDVMPGDLNGFRGSSDRSFHTIMVSGEPMQGTGQ
jgi:predicted lipoprotein with Yx(FWY)xxD motif